jgi:hypothetical protein
VVIATGVEYRGQFMVRELRAFLARPLTRFHLERSVILYNCRLCSYRRHGADGEKDSSWKSENKVYEEKEITRWI